MRGCIVANVTAFLVALLFTWAIPARAQERTRFRIALKINEDVEPDRGHLLASARNGGELTYTTPAGRALGLAPGAVLVRIERVNNPLSGYELRVDSNGDSDLESEKPQVVMPNSSIVVKVNRRWINGRQLVLPYSLKYSRERDQSGQTREGFLWMPRYRAEGRLRIRSCEALFAVMDLSSDGQFDSQDSSGTSIGLDRNGDERIWGKGEYLKAEQIIDYCGEVLLIDEIAVDGTSVTLVTTELRVPKVGEQLPAFLLTTIQGETIDSSSLRNKVHLLDFWASWCKPCVEKFSLVKLLSEEFKHDISIGTPFILTRHSTASDTAVSPGACFDGGARIKCLQPRTDQRGFRRSTL